jgi:hypothetical protein
MSFPLRYKNSNAYCVCGKSKPLEEDLTILFRNITSPTKDIECLISLLARVLVLAIVRVLWFVDFSSYVPSRSTSTRKCIRTRAYRVDPHTTILSYSKQTKHHEPGTYSSINNDTNNCYRYIRLLLHHPYYLHAIKLPLPWILDDVTYHD